jgi:16S rRNA C1402 (ribose-2'-O) methylase RsmI
MTKMHEAYHRGSVTKVLDILNEIVEDGKLKGEITLVVAPCADLESTLN